METYLMLGCTVSKKDKCTAAPMKRNMSTVQGQITLSGWLVRWLARLFSTIAIMALLPLGTKAWLCTGGLWIL